MCAPEDKRNPCLWEGTATAHQALPSTVPRLRLHDGLEWSAHGHAYRAELSEYVPLPALQAGGPVLTEELDLPSSWWADLRRALEATSTVQTDRQAVRQQSVDKNLTRFLGVPAFQVSAWTTDHGDLHWANLTGPPLVMLDWERRSGSLTEHPTLTAPPRETGPVTSSTPSYTPDELFASTAPYYAAFRPRYAPEFYPARRPLRP